MKGAICDAANDSALALDDGHGAMPPVEHQPCNIFPRHVGQLPAENILKSYQPAPKKQIYSGLPLYVLLILFQLPIQMPYSLLVA